MKQGKHLYTGASHGFEPSGVGSEVLIGEGMLGVAAERRAAVRTTSMTREMILTRAVRSAIERHGKQTLLAKEIPLPGLANAQSQLVLPLVVGNRLQGVLCLQDQIPGRFLATDERVLQIAARHLGGCDLQRQGGCFRLPQSRATAQRSALETKFCGEALQVRRQHFHRRRISD